MVSIRASLIVFIVAMTACATTEASACLPIYDRVVGLPVGTPATQLSRAAASVELMRATSREFASKGATEDSLDIYRFRLESVRVLKGASRGPLLIYAAGAFNTDRVENNPFGYLDWNDQQIRERGDGRRYTPEYQTRFGLTFLMSMREPRPGDPLPMCENPYALVLQRDYLVFRDANGHLMNRGFDALVSYQHGGTRRMWVKGMSIQRVFGAQDPWLRSVERANQREH